MRFVKPSSEEEMICEFLRAEIKSDRFAGDIRSVMDSSGISERVLSSPDLNNPGENAQRKLILAEYRQYGRNAGLFENFPDIRRWCWESLGPDDIRHIRYINYSYWNDLSGGTGSPLDAAENIKNGITSCGVPNDGFFRAAEALNSGQSFAPMILLRSLDLSLCIVLEGHVRLTAYALSGHNIEGIMCIVGYCEEEELHRWDGRE